jgi:outer membrane protein assembly factor BamB
MTHIRAVFILALVTAGAATTLGQAPQTLDWPQWRGPNRDGISRETGLLRQWPAAGPPRFWSRSDLGEGYGSLSVVGDRVFVQGTRGRDTAVFVLNRMDGKTLWARSFGASGFNDRGSGPRGTPTVDGDRVYVLTENGDLVCLRISDGSPVWQRNILRDFGARNIPWLISESPLIDGANVIVTPGGRGAGMVALDKMTGRTVWQARELNDEAGYASPIAADIGGVRVYMTLTAEAGVGVRASDGRLMWRYRPAANNTANIATPVVADNKVFYTSSYGTGGGLLALTAKGGEVAAQEVYFTRDMMNHHGGVIVLDGRIYGFHNNILASIDFATGKTVWRDRSVGKGSLTYADGHFYILSEDNVVGLVEANPTGYREKGRFQIADQGWPSWAHPVVSGGRLYIRNQGVLTAYDVRARTAE